jgi:hypothetical protein
MTRSFFVVVVMESAAKEFAAVAEEGFARIFSGFARIFLRCFGDKKKKEGEKEGEIEGREKEGQKQDEGEKTKNGGEKKKVHYANIEDRGAAADESTTVTEESPTFTEDDFVRIFPKNPVAALEGGFTRIFLPTRQRVGGGTDGARARFETIYPKMASVKFSTVFANPKLADDSIMIVTNPKLPTDVYVDGVFQREEEHSLFDSDVECENETDIANRLALLRRKPKRFIVKYTTYRRENEGCGSPV